MWIIALVRRLVRQAAEHLSLQEREDDDDGKAKRRLVQLHYDEGGMLISSMEAEMKVKSYSCRLHFCKRNLFRTGPKQEIVDLRYSSCDVDEGDLDLANAFADWPSPAAFSLNSERTMPVFTPSVTRHTPARYPYLF